MGKKIKKSTHPKEASSQEINKKEDEEKELIALLQSQQQPDDNTNEDALSTSSVSSINDINTLEDKLSSLQNEFKRPFTSQKITWLEKMDIISTNEIDPHLNPDDDIKRELCFYNIAKENAIIGMRKIKSMGEKVNRPDDYFVEMLKSDEQMANVKKEIIKEQQYIKKFEEKKQKLQNIKFAKSIKDYQNKEKSSFKRKTMEGIEQWKEHIKKNPKDYNKIDKFFDGKKKKKFNAKDLIGKSVRTKSKEKRLSDMRRYKKKQMKRPGKVKRMINRNRKNSKKGGK